jgi:lipopolysaccharide/colanic/teichoic acid biosynthesis glycosyltransferase
MSFDLPSLPPWASDYDTGLSPAGGPGGRDGGLVDPPLHRFRGLIEGRAPAPGAADRPGPGRGREAGRVDGRGRVGGPVKRACDYAIAGAALLALWPFMLLLAALIRLDSPGPAVFRQRRLGRGGRPFWVLKFRTMVVDAEGRLKDLEHLNESDGGVLFKLKRDPRVTRVGRFLRRTSLDELPQLFNVLRGEMSVVGPRPLQLRDSDYLERVAPREFARRLEVLPGLTGPWQVGGRSDLGFDRMLALDLDYIDNGSLGTDLRILWRTCRIVLLGRGAY